MLGVGTTDNITGRITELTLKPMGASDELFLTRLAEALNGRGPDDAVDVRTADGVWTYCNGAGSVPKEDMPDGWADKFDHTQEKESETMATLRDEDENTEEKRKSMIEGTLALITCTWSICVTLPMWLVLLFALMAANEMPVWAWVLFWCYCPASMLGGIFGLLYTQYRAHK